MTTTAPHQPAAALPGAAQPTASDPRDVAALRPALGTMATSVTLITTRHEGRDYGFTANSFTSVSSEPPLVAVFLADTAECYPAFEEADHVVVNVLAEGQGDLAMHFARKHEDKFAAVELDPAHPDVPVVSGAMAAIVGTVESRLTAGDHLMLLIAVDHVEHHDREPLVYQNRAFRKLI